MERLEKEWIKRPVLHLDLNIEKYDKPESLDNILDKALTQWEKMYGAEPSERSLSLRFAGIIQRAHEQSGQRVAILVDEYDKPMLRLSVTGICRPLSSTLKPFYGVLKTMDGSIQFAMLTRVTKFGKVSVFSDLNNLDDISMREPFVSVCGISEEELHAYFEEDIHGLASARNMTYDEACAELKEILSGYHFVENSIGIYNPFSLLNAFKYRQLDSYWFETGTPTYLVELLKKHHYDLNRMAHEETDSDTLNSIDSTSDNPIPVIYQSGYLTIKGYDRRFGLYRLGFPNAKWRKVLFASCCLFYANVDKMESPFQIKKFVDEVMAGDYDAFFRRLSSFFADVPYELASDLERHYQNVLFIVFQAHWFLCLKRNIIPPTDVLTWC